MQPLNRPQVHSAERLALPHRNARERPGQVVPLPLLLRRMCTASADFPPYLSRSSLAFKLYLLLRYPHFTTALVCQTKISPEDYDGITRSIPGLILSGSESLSLLASKIFMYLL